MTFLPSDGSISSLYEHCEVAFDILQTSINDLPLETQDRLESQRCSDEVGRLSIWADEVGAKGGYLDYTLRKSSRLQKRVIDLLEELEMIVSYAISNLKGEVHSDSDDDSSPVSEERSIGRSSDATSDYTDTSAQGSDINSSLLEQSLSHIHDINTSLLQLLQSLLDPIPHDSIVEVSSPRAAINDIQHVKEKFPHADPEIANRLGNANWKRRQHLIDLRSQQDEASMRQELKLQVDLIGSDATLPNSPSDASSHRGHSASKTSISSSGEISTNDRRTVFSTDISRISTDITSMTDLPQTKFIPPPVPKELRLRLPRPPPPNELANDQAFKCPYCFHNLLLIEHRADWSKHVMSDLEPYICTFTDCKRPDKKYGIKEDWIQHELQAHRLQRVWECGPCDLEFPTKVKFEDHMRKAHPLLFTEHQIFVITESCERKSKPKERSNCPLCLKAFSTEKELQRHLADEQEQLALFVALPAGISVPGEDDDLDDSDFSDTETRPESIKINVQEHFTGARETGVANVKRYLDMNATGDALTKLSPKIERPEFLSRKSTPTTSCLTQQQEEQVQFPVTTMVHPKSEHFFGREQELGEIRKQLLSPGRTCAIQGIGGVGKTLTAVEFAHRSQQDYDCIFWLQADTESGLAESCRSIATSLGLINGTEDQIQMIQLTREWLEHTERRWLLIFDNVENWGYVAHHLPSRYRQTKGSVLLTTQDSKISHWCDASLPLATFDEDEGSQILLQYLQRNMPNSDPDREIAKEISGLVGGLPVAIVHVAGYANYTKIQLADLLEIFKQRRIHAGIAVTEDDDLPASFRRSAFSYDETLSIVWNIALRELSKDAQDLIHILAFLDCEAVKESMLCAIHPEASLEFLDSRESIRFKMMKENLLARRLVTQVMADGELCLSTHRALKRNIRETLSKDPVRQGHVFHQAVSLVKKVFPTPSPVQIPQPETWLEYQKLLPHVLSLRKAYYEGKVRIQGSRKFVQLLADAGINQWEQGVTRGGLLLLRTAQDVLESLTFDGAELIKADIFTIIALMYDNTGSSNRAEGLERRQKALEIRKAHVKKLTYYDRTQETLEYNSRLDVSISLLQFNRYQEAEPILEKCFAKYQEWGPPEEFPYEYGIYYHWMSMVRMYQGRYPEAIQLGEYSVKWLGKTNNRSLMNRHKFDLACIILQSGDVDRALATHHEVYKARLEISGKANELTLHSCYAIGAIHEQCGRFAEAETWMKRTLDQRRAASWCEEAVARTQYHLSHLLTLQNKDPDRAAELLADADATLKRLLPLHYPECLKDVADLGVLYDHLLTVCAARFTGRGLLGFVR